MECEVGKGRDGKEGGMDKEWWKENEYRVAKRKEDKGEDEGRVDVEMRDSGKEKKMNVIIVGFW